MQTTLGHYRVIEPIGSGGMGAVYLARDERLERDVAIKVLSGVGPIDDEARRRFRKEALALSKLNHPHVATIHDFDTFDDQDVLVMEHIPGRDLADVVRDGPLPEAEIVRIGQQLLSALEAAHARHIIHRDLKPGNVRLTTDGRVKVLDFGLAQALAVGGDATTASLSAPGFAGTLPYMAPEQVRGDAVDARTDIYGAGAVLYEMATGTRVHPGLTGPRLLGAILEELPLPARGLNPRISPALEAILCKALDRDPRLRYQSAREMSVDLERLAAPAKPPAPVPVWRLKRALAAAMAAVLLAAGVAWVVWPPAASGSILVADIEDHTDDPDLARVVRELLTAALQQRSRHLNVLSHEQVGEALRRMGRAGRVPLDVDTAAELSERESIPVLLAGTAWKRGDRVLLTVRLIDPVTRAERYTDQIHYDREEELYNGVKRLADGIVRYLGKSGVTSDTRPLEQVTTPSISALKIYTRGTEAIRHGEFDEALTLFASALQRDPSFAMAHRMVARLYAITGDTAQASKHLTAAYGLRERLSEREQLLVEGAYFRADRQFEKAIRILTEATTLYPRDSEAAYELAQAYGNIGDTHQQIERLQKLVVQDPMFARAHGTLVLELARAEEYDRATEAYQEARQRQMRTAHLEWGHGVVMLGRDRLDQAREHFQELERSTSSGGTYAGIARLNLTTIDVLEGNLTDAAHRLEGDIQLAREAGKQAAELTSRYLLGLLRLLRGEREKAAEQVSHMLDQLVTADDRPDEWLKAGMLLVELGELPRAREVLTKLDEIRKQDEIRANGLNPFAESCYYNLVGELALAEGQPRDALQAFSSAGRQYQHHYPNAVTTYGLARAYSDQQQWVQAREMWTSLIESRGQLLFQGLASVWVIAHRERARTNRELGDIAAARADYETFLRIWQRAADLAVVREAREEFRALPLSSP
jgi:eukaryotic-like serine/threonine-protein kinase